MKELTKVFGFALMLFAGICVIGLRAKGFDLTEGQLLITYWRDWLAITFLFIAGLGIVVIDN